MCPIDLNLLFSGQCIDSNLLAVETEASKNHPLLETLLVITVESNGTRRSERSLAPQQYLVSGG